jgi:hypothetical protein
MNIWSSLLPRYTQKDSIEISFIFFGALLYFLHILEVYMIFWNSKRKNEKLKIDTQCWASFGSKASRQCSGPKGRNGPTGPTGGMARMRPHSGRCTNGPARRRIGGGCSTGLLRGAHRARRRGPWAHRLVCRRRGGSGGSARWR